MVHFFLPPFSNFLNFKLFNYLLIIDHYTFLYLNIPTSPKMNASKLIIKCFFQVSFRSFLLSKEIWLIFSSPFSNFLIFKLFNYLLIIDHYTLYYLNIPTLSKMNVSKLIFKCFFKLNFH